VGAVGVAVAVPDAVQDPAGALVVAERQEVVREGAGSQERVGMVRAEPATVEVVRVLEQRPAAPGSPRRRR